MVTENNSQCIVRTPVSYFSGRGQVVVSDLLRFGPMLQNAIMATSITKAVQTFGAMLSLRHIQAYFAAQSEVVICSASSACEVKIQVCDSPQNDEGIKGQMASDGKKENTCSVQEPKHSSSLKAGFEEPHSRQTKKMRSVIKQVSSHFLSQGKGKFVEVLHQKQTSQQLIRFIKMIGDTDGHLHVTFFRGKDFSDPGTQTPPAGQQEVTSKWLREKEKDLPISSLKLWFSSSMGPASIFKVKRSDHSGSLVYSCMVATESELWDVGDISTNGAGYVSERTLVGEKELLVEPSGESYFEVLGASQDAARTPVIPTAAQTDIHNVPQFATSEPEGRADSTIKIPEFKICRYKEMEVTVSHLINPVKFFIQHVSPQLQQLSQKMDSSAQIKCVPDIGVYVAGWFPKCKLWCRAQVVRICGIQGGGAFFSGGEKQIEVEVRRIDFGDTACLALSHLRELDSDVAEVSPLNGQDWTPEAVGWFKDKVDGRTLYARLFQQGEDFRAELFMEKGKMGAMRRGSSLSLRLAQNGHAKHDQLRRSGWQRGTLRVATA
ncbi:hypothetical protein JZ751_020133 [Albula glossodonta]|uniref:Tudor domain-containing protein n=1 Tax=Albula glossodonta TaxID=121402 RepID=A0A8T2NP05_9TELE|nr:hypothetical protein JZ751_020133 [Albula glossodonta]